MLGCSGSTTSDQKATPTAAASSNPTATPQITPTAQPAQAGTSKSNPAPVGTAVTAADDSSSSPYSAKVTLLEYQKGQTAYDMLKSWDKYGIIVNAPDEGKEYHIVKIKFELLTTKNDASHFVNSLDFDAVTSGNVYTSELMTVASDKDVSGDMYPGGSKEGWIAFQLPTGSSSVLIAYDRNMFDGSVKAWFSTA